MGKLIELIFQRVYMAMIATAIFWLLTLSGGLFFGLAPAGSTLMTLFQQYRYDYKRYHWQEAWTVFKSNFVCANQIFYSFFIVEGVLFYGIFLLAQLPHQTILHILLAILDLVFLLVAPLSYAVYLKLQVYFELSYKNWFKLALIGPFLNISAVLKVLLGTILLSIAGYYIPALLFFVFIGVWHFFISDVLEPIYQIVQSKLIMKEQ